MVKKIDTVSEPIIAWNTVRALDLAPPRLEQMVFML